MPYIVIRSVAPLTAGNGTAFAKVGHAWIEISDSIVSPGGKTESYGLYPENSSPLALAKVADTDYDDFVGHGFTSQRYYITENEAQFVRLYALEADAGVYALLPGQLLPLDNCATFAFEAMRRAGVNTSVHLHNVVPWWLPALFDTETQISATVTTYFHAAATFAGTIPPLRADPLTLDLDNDGIETIGINIDNPIRFDHDGDGIKTATGWIKPDDGLLVLDRNGNGTIDDGGELFGDNTPLYAGGKALDGFAALAQEDTNADGRVDVADAHFGQLRLWRDLNQDGISQSGELFTLAQQGIAALLVSKTENAIVLDNGNQLADLGGFIRSDGSGGTLGLAERLADIDLASDPFYSQFTDHVPVTDAALALPDVQGSGMVRNLREAASLQTPQGAMLASKLAQYATATTQAEQFAMLDGLVDAWAATSAQQTHHGTQLSSIAVYWKYDWSPALGAWQWRLHRDEGPLDPESNGKFLAMLQTVEAFNAGGLNGDAFYPEQFTLLQQSHAAIKTSVYGGLVLQTRLKPYLDAISLDIDERGVSLNYNGMMALLEANKGGDLQNAVLDLLDLSKYGGNQLVGWDWLAEIESWIADPATGSAVMTVMGFVTPTGTWGGGSGADYALGGSAADNFSGNLGDDMLMGAGGNDTLVGNSGIHTLVGGAGDDLLMAGSNPSNTQLSADTNERSANTLRGGPGADRLYGGGGADTYRFDSGDGADTIFEVAYNHAAATDVAIDSIVLGAGISPTEVNITRNNTDLIVKFANPGDQITVPGWYNNSGSRIEQMVFADGTIWDRATLHAAGLVVQGTAGADTLYGLAGEADRLIGNGGNDTLIGESGNDTLTGGAGDDLLRATTGIAFNGSDLSERESDANILEGGPGSDRLYGGGGPDTYRYSPGDGADTIFETWYVSPDGTNRSDTATDRIELGPGIVPADLGVTRSNLDLILQFANAGDQITVAGWYNTSGNRIEQLVFADGGIWDRARLHAAGLLVQGTAGADTLYGLGGEADLLYGNGGNDTLIGDSGNDTLIGGAGDDTLRAAFGPLFNGAEISERESDSNTLEGGAGNDRLYGGGGSDTYRYGLGDGADTIVETSYASPDGTTRSDNATDRILLGAGIAPMDVTPTRNNADLLLKFANAGDQITVPGWYNSSASRIEQMVFADGTIWDRATLHAGGLVVRGTSGADTLIGLANEADALYGNDGNDILVGDSGSDTLVGGAGDDTLRAGSGPLFNGLDISSREGNSNTLEGGTGNDRLYGGGGSDTYRFDPGDGADTIFETNYNPDATTVTDIATDRILLGAGIVPADVTVTRNNSDLILKSGGVGDQITVSGWYANPGNRIEQLVFHDGTVWDRSTLHTSGLRVLGTPGADVLYGLPGEADVLDGLGGNDQLFGDRGNDVYLFGLGSGQDTINENDATPGNVDTVRIKSGVSPGALTLGQSGAALTLSIKGTTDKITVANWFSGSQYRIERIEFLDGANGTVGTVWMAAEIDRELAAAANIAPVLAVPIASQSAAENLPFEFVVPSNTFTDANAGDHLNYSAKLDNGDLLPAWLSFDPAAVRFSGIPTVGSPGRLTLRLTATDDAGASASGAFVMDITHQVLGAAGGQALTGTAYRDAMNGLAGNDTLIGMAGDDTLDGGTGKDSLAGGPGDDTYMVDNAGDVVVEAVNEGTDVVIASVSYQLADNIENLTLAGTRAINGTGNALNNTISGNAAANSLNGGAGADTLVGNLGNDVYVVDDIGDSVVENAGEGTDTVQSFLRYVLGPNLENLTLLGDFALDGTGNELNNQLTGNSAANVLSGGAGNDTLNGGAGTDTLIGGPGNDVYVIDDLGDRVIENPDEGIDTVQSTLTYLLGANIENLVLQGSAAVAGTGNELHNRLTGNSADNLLSGGVGNDTLNGGGGSDTLVGGPGNDTYVVDDAGVVLIEDAGAGTDTVQSSTNYALGANLENLTLTGTEPLSGAGNELNNLLIGNAADNLLDGGPGNDTLRGGAGADTLMGGIGDDSYTVESATEVIVELPGEGNDLVSSSATYTLPANVERLTLTGTASIDGYGNEQDNQLLGNGASNVLYGHGGNDTLNGGAGADTLAGGPGNDSYTVDNAGDVVIEAADEGVDVVIASVSYQLPANVENLTLSGATASEATGNALDNLLTGNGIANLLSAGAGNDTLDGKAGADTLVGGPGADIYFVDNVGDRIVEAAGEGDDTAYSTVSRILDSDVENLILLGSAALSGTGNAGSNLLRGNAGNNTLDGKAGIDFLEGLAGNDTLTDTIDNNYFYGGAGNDKLTAGPGNDLLIGGAGNDTLRPGDGYDVIAFNRGDGYDTIYIGTNARDTISLGGGIAYSDLSFRKVGNDLVLDTGSSEGMVLKNWYLGAANKNVVGLQVLADAISGFDFKGLVGAFDRARLATPTLTSWALINGLSEFGPTTSDDHALGGDLAYRYGKNGSLAGIGLASALSVMGDPQFGVQPLGLHPFSGLQEGIMQLI